MKRIWRHWVKITFHQSNVPSETSGSLALASTFHSIVTTSRIFLHLVNRLFRWNKWGTNSNNDHPWIKTLNRNDKKLWSNFLSYVQNVLCQQKSIWFISYVWHLFFLLLIFRLCFIHHQADYYDHFSGNSKIK